MFNTQNGFDRHSTITRPLDGRLSKGKVLLMMAFVWIYCTPWALLPLLKIWGRYVPGERIISHSLKIRHVLTRGRNQHPNEVLVEAVKTVYLLHKHKTALLFLKLLIYYITAFMFRIVAIFEL